MQLLLHLHCHILSLQKKCLFCLFITKDLSYVGFFTDDRVCLIDIEADGIQELEDWIMEDAAVEFILAKKPILLNRTAEYEQLKLFS